MSLRRREKSSATGFTSIPSRSHSSSDNLNLFPYEPVGSLRVSYAIVSFYCFASPVPPRCAAPLGAEEQRFPKRNSCQQRRFHDHLAVCGRISSGLQRHASRGYAVYRPRESGCHVLGHDIQLSMTTEGMVYQRLQYNKDFRTETGETVL